MNIEDIKILAKKVARNHLSHNPFNIFSEWNMSENDHTKLLLAMLRYYGSANRYPVLQSFLNRFARGRDKKVYYKYIENLEISFNKDFIDGLITFTVSNRKYALIIENKINFAPDQDRQISRYIGKVTDVTALAIPLENVWVFYLTGDNNKVVSVRSYKFDKEPPETNIGSRFVSINYCDDILSWLKEDVLKYRVYPESLTSVVRAYVDYLENDHFCKDPSNEEIDSVLLKVCGKKGIQYLSAENIEQIYDLQTKLIDLKSHDKDESTCNRKELNWLYCLVSFILEKLEADAFGKFEEITKSVLKEKSNLEWKVAHRGLSGHRKGYIQIRLVDEWDTIHMEWEQVDIISMLYSTKYSIALHIEKKDLQESWISKIKTNKGNLPSDIQIKKSKVRYLVSTTKPFAKMDDCELESCLSNLYNEDLYDLFYLIQTRLSEYRLD